MNGNKIAIIEMTMWKVSEATTLTEVIEAFGGKVDLQYGQNVAVMSIFR